MFQALTGCDTVSSFNWCGKKTTWEAWKVWCGHGFPLAQYNGVWVYVGATTMDVTTTNEMLWILYGKLCINVNVHKI